DLVRPDRHHLQPAEHRQRCRVGRGAPRRAGDPPGFRPARAVAHPARRARPRPGPQGRRYRKPPHRLGERGRRLQRGGQRGHGRRERARRLRRAGRRQRERPPSDDPGEAAGGRHRRRRRPADRPAAADRREGSRRTGPLCALLHRRRPDTGRRRRPGGGRQGLVAGDRFGGPGLLPVPPAPHRARGRSPPQDRQPGVRQHRRDGQVRQAQRRRRPGRRPLRGDHRAADRQAARAAHGDPSGDPGTGPPAQHHALRLHDPRPHAAPAGRRAGGAGREHAGDRRHRAVRAGHHLL
ncbi:MAG: putative diacylglycerol kinase catalytic domain, partial [uncultured Blastococcus sp.]